MKYVFGLCILVFLVSSCGDNQSSSSMEEDGSRNEGWECVSGDCDNGIGTHVDSSFTQDYFEIRRYNGEWKDRMKHGYGTWLDSSSEKLIVTEDGNMHPAYKFTNEDSIDDKSKDSVEYIIATRTERYDGGWLNNRWHGKGDWKQTANGSIIRHYKGGFKNGSFHGKGVSYRSKRSYYDGEWVNGRMHGSGVYIDSSRGEKYTGEFIDGLRHGKGQVEFLKGINKDHGDKFVGDFVSNKKEGKGTYTFANGGYYSGDYKHGKRHGSGIQVTPKGSYDGEWKNGKQHGKGISTWTNNGDKYEGGYVAGKLHGYGVYTFGKGSGYFLPGNKYEGEWKNGLQDGKGTTYVNFANRYLQSPNKTKDEKGVGFDRITSRIWKDGKETNLIWEKTAEKSGSKVKSTLKNDVYITWMEAKQIKKTLSEEEFLKHKKFSNPDSVAVGVSFGNSISNSYYYKKKMLRPAPFSDTASWSFSFSNGACFAHGFWTEKRKR